MNEKIKEFLKRVFTRFVVINLLAMLLVIVLLCLGVSFGLDYYTHHGEGIEVPDLIGVDCEEAADELESLGLEIQVSDSGYNKVMAANSILLQTPGHGQKVKRGHVIYVTVNSPSSPAFALPDIIDNSSVREATAKLTAMGFKLETPKMVDGERDWVYGILCKGRRVSNGDRISIDHPLTLIVGKGTFEDLDDVDMVDAEDAEAGNGAVDEFEEVKEP